METVTNRTVGSMVASGSTKGNETLRPMGSPPPPKKKHIKCMQCQQARRIEPTCVMAGQVVLLGSVVDKFLAAFNYTHVLGRPASCGTDDSVANDCNLAKHQEFISGPGHLPRTDLPRTEPLTAMDHRIQGGPPRLKLHLIYGNRWEHPQDKGDPQNRKLRKSRGHCRWTRKEGSLKRLWRVGMEASHRDQPYHPHACWKKRSDSPVPQNRLEHVGTGCPG